MKDLHLYACKVDKNIETTKSCKFLGWIFENHQVCDEF